MNHYAYSILLIGQLKTARTETLENFLKSRSQLLCVIGLMSPYATLNESRFSLYEKGQISIDGKLPNYLIKNTFIKFKDICIFISFLYYVFAIFKSFVIIKKKFNIFIGCATFSTVCGIILKKIGIVKFVIYYSLDYYVPPNKNDYIKYFVNSIYQFFDSFCINNSDIVWDISPRLYDARSIHSTFDVKHYCPIIVPMGWGSNVSRNVPLKNRDRWAIGFIGTLSDNQGLQMVVSAFPKLLEKYPKLTLHIIGHGPYYSEIRSLIKYYNLESSIRMYGFISDEQKAYDILQFCMIGIAPWTGDDTDNSHFADPGKPKLYALLGLPVLLTKYTMISTSISELNAGMAIDYSEDDFVNAVDFMIGDISNYKKFIDGLESFKSLCYADSIFSDAFNQTFLHIKDSVNA
jgi:glycosyltransferase involved in cell wall biosynthesis